MVDGQVAYKNRSLSGRLTECGAVGDKCLTATSRLPSKQLSVHVATVAARHHMAAFAARIVDHFRVLKPCAGRGARLARKGNVRASRIDYIIVGSLITRGTVQISRLMFFHAARQLHGFRPFLVRALFATLLASLRTAASSFSLRICSSASCAFARILSVVCRDSFDCFFFGISSPSF